MSLKQSELLPQISSSQKDKFYLDHLRGLVNDAVNGILGSHRIISWSKELQLMTDALYFGITTLQGLQTLGEEYSGIIQVDQTRRNLPSLFRRVCMVAGRILAPYFIDKVFANIENRIAKDEELSNTNLQNMVHRVRLIFSILNRFHLSLFYLRGLYYAISKRFASVMYVRLVKPGSNANLHLYAFRLLGILSLTQSVVALSTNLYSLFYEIKTFRVPQTRVTSQIDESPSTRCGLCLERRKSTTSTPCGHLFCWHCIHSWVQAKPECPFCREPLKAQRLICLMNFA